MKGGGLGLIFIVCLSTIGYYFGHINTINSIYILSSAERRFCMSKINGDSLIYGFLISSNNLRVLNFSHLA
jgi:hypothetical protein